MAFLPLDDFDVFDNIETGSFYSRTANDTYAAPISCDMLVVEMDKDLRPVAPARGGASRAAVTDMVVHLRASDLGATTPKTGDKIVRADSTVCHITGRVAYQTFLSRYSCPVTVAR